ncbi:MAG: winged helix-turn-helix transcriptional regulator [Acidimicrobiales bacterium]
MTSKRQVTPSVLSNAEASDAGDLGDALRRIGDRWSLLVVDALRDGPRRYGELERAVGGIAPNVLAKRLRTLEADGLIVAAPYQDRPVRMAYELTQSGRNLTDALALLRAWGGSGRSDAGVFHDRCGTELQLRLWCPTCERVVDDAHADELHHL